MQKQSSLLQDQRAAQKVIIEGAILGAGSCDSSGMVKERGWVWWQRSFVLGQAVPPTV